jgi:hypothetical protein
MYSPEARAYAQDAVTGFLAWRRATQQRRPGAQPPRPTFADRILAVLPADGTPLSQARLRDALHVSGSNLSVSLKRLMTDGKVERIGTGENPGHAGRAVYLYRRLGAEKEAS